jgi:hypothetical protein
MISVVIFVAEMLMKRFCSSSQGSCATVAFQRRAEMARIVASGNGSSGQCCLTGFEEPRGEHLNVPQCHQPEAS